MTPSHGELDNSWCGSHITDVLQFTFALDDQRQISRLLLARVHRGNDIGRSADDSDFLLGGFIWKHRQRRVEQITLWME